MNPLFEAFTRAVLDRITPQLRSGLSSAQLNWAVNAFHRSILPEYFQSGEPDTQGAALAQAQIVAEDILAEWSKLDTAGKWGWVLRKAYGCRLLPLSRAAFHAAQTRYEKKGSLEGIIKQAQPVQLELEKIIAELEKHVPGVRAELAEVISETTLDCLYAQGKGGGLSLRLGRLIRRGLA